MLRTEPEEIRSVLALVRQQHEQINDEALALIQHGKEQIIAKSGVLEMLHVIENATDIGGLENLKTRSLAAPRFSAA